MPPENAHHCPLCDADTGVWSAVPGRDSSYCECPNCGTYVITRQAMRNLRSEQDIKGRRYLLSGLSRVTSDSGGQLTIMAENMRQLIESHSAPPDPMSAIEQLISFIGEHQQDAASFVAINRRGAIVTAKSVREFLFYTKVATDLGLLEKRSDQDEFRLTINGWQRVSEKGKLPRKGDQVFVAMSFASDLDAAWADGFRPALKESGLDPIRVDLVHHNGKICDRILAEIRRSVLLVADFTGNRGGVYFEAGFGLGLGLPVIWSCRDTDIDSVHFDTRQYNHVVWSDPSDLRMKLGDRILATVPLRGR